MRSRSGMPNNGLLHSYNTVFSSCSPSRALSVDTPCPWSVHEKARRTTNDRGRCRRMPRDNRVRTNARLWDINWNDGGIMIDILECYFWIIFTFS